MLNALPANRYSTAILLRLAELIVFCLLLFALALIGSMYSGDYYVTRYTSANEILRAAVLFILSPIYIVAALFFSVKAISGDRLLRSVIFWIVPSIFCFFTYNMFVNSILPTFSLLIASFLTILSFKTLFRNEK